MASGFVYFIHCPATSLIKIGMTDGPPSWRLANIQAMSPTQLVGMGVIKGGREKEKDFHEAFAHLRTHGEWFRADDSLLAFVRRHARAWPAFPEAPKTPGPDRWGKAQEKAMDVQGWSRPYVPEYDVRDVGFPPGYDPKTAPIVSDDIEDRLRAYEAAFGGDLMLEAAEELRRLRQLVAGLQPA